MKNLMEIDIDKVPSAVLRLLIEEVRNETGYEENVDHPSFYNRPHNRHNRGGGYNRAHNRHNRGI